MEIVINKCYGGFGLSEKAVMRYAEIKGIKIYPFHDDFITHYYTVPVDGVALKGDYLPSPDVPNETYFSTSSIERDDSVLVQVVKELGKAASGEYSELSVVEIPDGVEYEITDYDGYEHIAEKHRTWG